MSDVFDDNASIPATVETASTVDSLVGEGRKFRTAEDLAKAKLESDRYIDQLKNELNEAKTQIGRAANLEDQFTQLKEEITQLRANSQPKVETRENTAPQLSETDVEALVSKVMTRKEAQRSASENVAEANRKVLEAYGSVEKAKEVVRAKAVELGLSVDALRDTAASSPTAFLRLVLDTQATATGRIDLSRSTVNTSSQQVGSGPKPGTKAYFDKLRKDNPKAAYSEDTYQQMEAAIRAGTYK